MPNINDIVLIEDTTDQFNGRVARVSDRTYENLTPVHITMPATGGVFCEYIDTDKLSEAIDPATSQLLIEKCCSACHKLNWDNRTGGYKEKHLNEDTGVEVLCDDLGKMYVEGDLVPPEVTA